MHFDVLGGKSLLLIESISANFFFFSQSVPICFEHKKSTHAGGFFMAAHTPEIGTLFVFQFSWWS